MILLFVAIIHSTLSFLRATKRRGLELDRVYLEVKEREIVHIGRRVVPG